MADHHSEAATALDPTVNAQDTTVLFQHLGGEYLLIAANSAREATRTLIDAVAERNAQAAPLHERADRLRKIALTISFASAIPLAAGMLALVLGLVQAILEGLLPFATVACLTGGAGLLIGLGLLGGQADSWGNKASRIELVHPAELFGGIHLPSPGGQEFISRHPLPDGSLLIRLHGESRYLRTAAQSLTGEQRSQVLALAKNDLVSEALAELAAIGLRETERRTQEVLREANGERHPGKRGLFRALLGRG